VADASDPPAPAAGDPRDAWRARTPKERAVALRTISKEARWARAKAEVGLTDVQIARLREAVVERDRSLEGKTAIVTRLMEGLPLTTVTGDSDEWTTLAEVGAIEIADARFDERAKEVLTAEQRARWEAGGFSRAFGVRLPYVPRPWAPTYVLPLPLGAPPPR
jgi:hypothetical protein